MPSKHLLRGGGGDSKSTGRDFGEVRKGTRAVHGWYLKSVSGDLKRERGVDWI